MRRVPLCLAVAAVAAAHPVAARPVRKAPAARRAVSSTPQEVLAEGVCRYRVTMTGSPVDEVRFAFQSEDLTLPRHGAVTPIAAERDYRQDLPPGAPENERRAYAHEVSHFNLAPEKAAAGDSGPKQWIQARRSPGLPPGPEARVLGLPWISLPAPRAGLAWQRTEALDFPHIRGRFRYRITELTTVAGRRAWRVERSLTGGPKALGAVEELKGPAEVRQWQETFWVDAADQALLRMERRVRLAGHGQIPLELSLDVDWTRKGARPLSGAEYQARVQFFGELAQIERQVMDARARTTLDGASDLRELQHKLEGLREDHPQQRYQLTFEKLGTAIQDGLQSFQQRANSG